MEISSLRNHDATISADLDAEYKTNLKLRVDSMHLTGFNDWIATRTQPRSGERSIDDAPRRLEIFLRLHLDDA
ncbi:hypothetical protein, partial [Burkholderia multivorans]|uniref:hypothetical protein n=1 Tax=Burkholderia multivorans TaxID=87883 RepID=UPI00286FD854